MRSLAAGASERRYMLLAIEEARRALGRTSPNPAVGAVVVRDERVVGRGYHSRAGRPHAEVEALRDAGPLARGGDLYSTLEPCDHQGRTPPCTAAILKAGIRRVVVGSDDPNPLVSGRGIRRLRSAGLTVVQGVARSECDALNSEWFHFITTGRPHVTLKAAITADGKLASGGGDSRWISGTAARRRVQELRSQVDAIMVGAGTVRQDDPRLTSRIPGARSPLRVVLDGRLTTSPAQRVYRPRSPGSLVVTAVTAGSSRRTESFSARGIEVAALRGRGGRVPLESVLSLLAERGIVRLLVEGGAELFGEFVEGDLWNRLLLFVAPKVLGEHGLPWLCLPRGRRMADALILGAFQVEQVGPDALLRIDRAKAAPVR
jgi:diaminohydroxyphosphoribosylaminopyrimidine deaminase / 5-amino-6-(5-phosphoribosylamino)uracil reductase